MKIGLYGGGFDPIHNGHIALAQTVRQAVDEVWIMPCYQHRYGKQPAAPEHRLEMCRLAAVGLDGVRVSGFEVSTKSDGVAYNTLVEMTKQLNHDFKFVIGQDNADTIEKWRFSDKLVKEFAFIVISCGQPGLDWYRRPPHTFIDTPIVSARSTVIRQMLSQQDPAAAQHLAPSVLQYIRENRLYG